MNWGRRRKNLFNHINLHKGNKLNILLFTNCDSDNLGDQVIEACAISLIRTALKNLGISRLDYSITSKQAGLIKKKYVETKNPSLLKEARGWIEKSDIVIFGGAPMFNFRYQIFYERTASLVELAKECGKPVAFSAIGVEQYEENDPKCQRLKQALNLDCVKQITTRDGIEELRHFKAREDLPIGKVADPAVFTKQVFTKHINQPPALVKGDGTERKKKALLFVLREGGFSDNGIDFNYKDAIKLWLGIIDELKRRGLDYELISSGHVTDEAFMDYLNRKENIPEKKCVFNMNSPEQLIEKISSADVILSTRLHPSIISYSLGVPSVGLVWNRKVKQFYENTGNSDRVVQVADATPETIVDKLLEAMDNGVSQDPAFMITGYESIFNGVRRCLESIDVPFHWNPQAEPFTYAEVVSACPSFSEPTEKQMNTKLLRKFRRIYEAYNKRNAKLRYLAESDYRLCYHSKGKGDRVQPIPEMVDRIDGELVRLTSGALQISLNELADGRNPQTFIDCPFTIEKRRFKSWEIRFRMAGHWYWLLEDGSIVRKTEYDKMKHKKRMRFQPGDRLPEFVNAVDLVVVEAVWSKNIGTIIDKIQGTQI